MIKKIFAAFFKQVALNTASATLSPTTMAQGTGERTRTSSSACTIALIAGEKRRPSYRLARRARQTTRRRKQVRRP